MKNKKIVAIIQARMGSTRLPGKVMEKIGKKTILEILVNRLKKSKYIDEIVIATTKDTDDDKIIDLSNKLGVNWHRGSEDDVLKRYIEAARIFNANTIVRVTADNPLTDPFLTDKLLKKHLELRADYTYCENIPVGVGVEIIQKSALEKIDKNAKLRSDREHVTLYLRNNPQKFKVHKIYSSLDNKRFRVTVDTKDDLKVIKELNEELGSLEKIKTEDLIKFLEKNPKIAKINLQKPNITPKSHTKNLKISIIIRTHNSEKFVKVAINSAINQSVPFGLYEIVVVDDGSNDNTLNILKTYKDRIIVIKEKNLGPIKSINRGIEQAIGDYVILLDSDDFLEPNALQEFLNKINNKEVDFVYSDYYEIDTGKNEFKVISLKNNIFNSVAGGIVFKKSVIEKLGGYDEDLLFPEYDLLIKLIKNGHKHKYVAKPLFRYYRHERSLTSNRKYVNKGLDQLFKKYGDINGLRRY